MSSVLVFIKTISGLLLSLQISSTITQWDFYLAVHKLLNDHAEFPKCNIDDLILYHSPKDDEEDGQKIEHDMYDLSPQENEIFFVVVEPFPFHFHMEETGRVLDENFIEYFILSVIISDLPGSIHPRNHIYNKKFLVRIPKNDGELFFPEFYKMEDIQVIHMLQLADGKSRGLIQNPDRLHHKHSDILLLIRGGYWAHHTYFSVHQHRYDIMLSKLERKWNRLLRSVIDFETVYIPEDDGENEDDILDPELNEDSDSDSDSDSDEKSDQE